jgi:hypothetical protein
MKIYIGKIYTAIYETKEGFNEMQSFKAKNIKEARYFAQAFKSRNNIKGITKVFLTTK